MSDKPEAVYLPSNEPYLGRESVYHFDQVILSCLDANKKIASLTHNSNLTELQQAACQIIPQGINLALTIRELIRQGYLFGALVLIRPLIERAAIISHLQSFPEKIQVWKEGWKHRERPSLNIMLNSMTGEMDIEKTKKVCDTFNHIVHGDPIGADWNLIEIDNNALGYSVGKVTNNPELCDFICYNSYNYLIVLMGRMASIFPNDSTS